MTTNQADESQWHHVINRGARQLPIFGDPGDCRSFLALLRDATAETATQVHAFALMPNHFHLLTHGNPASLARTMQVVAATYTRRFNRRYGYDGSLFKGRYRAFPIESDQHLLAVVRYIHRNPFVEGGDHQMLRTDRWTSHPYYRGDAVVPAWLPTDLVLRRCGGRVGYHELMAAPGEVEQPELSYLRTRLASLADVERALGIDSPVERAALKQGGRGIRNEMRLAALVLATESTSVGMETIADRYGYQSASSGRTAITRARARLATDPVFASIVDQGRSRLTNRQRCSAA